MKIFIARKHRVSHIHSNVGAIVGGGAMGGAGLFWVVLGAYFYVLEWVGVVEGEGESVRVVQKRVCFVLLLAHC